MLLDKNTYMFLLKKNTCILILSNSTCSCVAIINVSTLYRKDGLLTHTYIYICVFIYADIGDMQNAI